MFSGSTLPFVLLLLTLFFFSTQVLVCLCIDDYHHQVNPECNKPFQCGFIQNISYPFRQRGSPEYCGQPGFELYCKDDDDNNNNNNNNNPIPMITIMARDYQVIAFNTTLKSLTVAPANGSEHNLLCPDHLVNSSLNLSPFHFAWNTMNTTLYYHCPMTTANQFRGLSNRQFNCSSRVNGSTDHVIIIGYFVVTSAFDQQLSAAAKAALASCSSTVVVPVFTSMVQFLEHNPSQRNLVAALANGFGLQWTGNDSPSAPGSSDGSNSKLKLIITGLGVGGAIIVVIGVMFIALWLKKASTTSRGKLRNFQRGKRKHCEKIEAFILQYGSDLAPKRYTFSDIKKITKSFADELGQGGFGTVFKGRLRDGRLVAVKVLSESKGDGEEFINEVATISRTSHVNVVTFIGFCYEGTIRALIYEFMPNGSLDKFICHRHSPPKCHQLELKTLYDIAIGIARGLEYLHQGCNTRILHLDIKPHNILLDENLCPKISDFGLAKLCERKESILSTMSARGTIGYIAPEIFCRSFGGVSHKSDVYSYGMMVLEMVGEKENVHSHISTETSEPNFPLLIYERLQQGGDLDLQRINSVENEEIIISRKMMIVSLWCIQSNPSDRPSMAKVLEMLQGSVQALTIPPTPFLFSPQRSPKCSSTTSLFTGSSFMDYNS